MNAIQNHRLKRLDSQRAAEAAKALADKRRELDRAGFGGFLAIVDA